MPEVLEFPEPHVYHAYGIYLLKTRHRFIRKLQSVLDATAHGNRAWDASFVLMDYLQANPPSAKSSLVDIGCGWGLVGVHCAKNYDCSVTCVDKDPSVFSYVRVLAALNKVSVKTLHKQFDRLTSSMLEREQVIVGADICFWSDLVKPLKNLVNRARKSGVERIVIADPGRQSFHELADLCRRAWDAEVREWYALEPYRKTGYILEMRFEQ